MSEADLENLSEAKIRRLRLLKKIGLPICGLAVAYISIPMLIGAFSGLASDRVWDPYTGELLEEQEGAEARCIEDARDLMTRAGALEKFDPIWEQRTRGWIAQCRDDFPSVYQMLIETRTRLRDGEPSQEMGDDTGDETGNDSNDS